MGITSNFANVATVTRASTKTDAGGWDFTSGGTVGTLTEYASGVAAIHSTAGLLVEESTTNEIRNPRCEGATTGTLDTTGALPTHWATAGLATSEWTVNGTGTEDGWPYIELSYSGSDTSADIYFEGNTQVSAMTQETWTGHAGIKLVSGSLADTTVRLRWQDLNGAGTQLGVGNLEITPTSSRSRFASTRTTAGGGTQAYVRMGMQFLHSAAAAYTVRIYAPQLEEKAYPTSPVLPVVSSPAATTRSADSIIIPNGAWSNDDGAGSFYVEAVSNIASTGSGFVYFASYGSNGDNVAGVFQNLAPDAVRGFVEEGNVNRINHQLTTAIPAVTPGTSVVFAIGWADDDFAVSQTGETQTTTSSGSASLGTGVIYLGRRADGSSSTIHPSCYIKDLRYWPKRLTNAELEALVGN